jgi:hypothetical protein
MRWLALLAFLSFASTVVLTAAISLTSPLFVRTF